MENKKISIVIPIFNETSNISVLYKSIKKNISSLKYDYEIIFIDDGSTDNSTDVLSDLNKENHRVKVISFSRNFGHQYALTAGYNYASGDAVISMDGDMQHPPEVIPELIKKWEEGFSIVSTTRKSAPDYTLFKKFTSKLFYKIVNIYSQIKIDPNVSDFRLLDRKALDIINSCKEHQPFFRGMVKWIGFKQTCIDFEPNPRHSGKTKYSLAKMLRLASSGIFSYSNLPLYSVVYLCIIFTLAGFFYGTYILLERLFTDNAIPGNASVLGLTLFVAAVQFYGLSIISVYILKTYNEVKKRGVYIIQSSKGFDI